MIKKLTPFILAFSLLILGLAIGFYLGKRSPQITNSTPPPSNPTFSNNLYSHQTASIRGEITKIDGRNLTIKNLNNNVTGEQLVSSRILISKASTSPSVASPSSDLSTLELNKEALIQLEMFNDHYEIISIQYVLPAPSLAPIPSNRPNN